MANEEFEAVTAVGNGGEPHQTAPEMMTTSHDVEQGRGRVFADSWYHEISRDLV